jgi:IS30 family transposase
MLKLVRKSLLKNTRKLIRKYKMLRIEIINQKDKHTEIQYIVEKRPREIMNFESPKYIFYKFINGNVAFHT